MSIYGLDYVVVDIRTTLKPVYHVSYFTTTQLNSALCYKHCNSIRKTLNYNYNRLTINKKVH